MAELRLVIFDCDGTLVDSATHIVEAMGTAFAASGLAPPHADDVKSVIGLSLHDAIRRLSREAPSVVDSLVAAYKAQYRNATAARIATEPMFEGVAETLTRLNDGATLLAVATGKSRAGLTRILNAHDLGHHFAATMTADDAPSKPAPEMVLRLLSQIGADASRSVVIGDSTFDVEMARRAGAFAIGVTWGYHSPARLKRAGAHQMASTMTELPSLVDQLVAP
ncbi:MAG: HAD-IA family hydrolase [Pseudomonadota bacterium]